MLPCGETPQMGRAFITTKSGTMDADTLNRINSELGDTLKVMAQERGMVLDQNVCCFCSSPIFDFIKVYSLTR